MGGPVPMWKIPLLALLLALATATAGCLGGDEPPADDGGNTPPPTDDDNNTAPLAVVNGTDTVPGGPQASKAVTISVPANYSQLAITFQAQGSASGSPIGGQAIQQFEATLADPEGAEAGTSNALGTGLAVSNPEAGDWTLTVTFASLPSESVVVAWSITPP